MTDGPVLCILTQPLRDSSRTGEPLGEPPSAR